MTILEAVNNYLLKYLGITQDILFQGYEQLALPNTQDYVVYYFDSAKRIGTNVDTLTDAGTSETLNTNTLREYVATIDINNVDNEVALARAETLETLGRSSISTEFFEKLGIEYLYAEDFQYLPFEDETQQYNHRYKIKIHLSKWSNVSQDYDYFNKLKMNVIENVDVAHKP